MKEIEGFDTFGLQFGDDGGLKNAGELSELIARAHTHKATDVVFLAHGFRNDENDATALYSRFLATLRQNLARPEFAEVAARRLAIAGIYWPSKTFREAGIDEPGETRSRGISHEGESLAAIEHRLETLKAHDATAAQRKKLEHAIGLLPRLNGDPGAQDAFVHDVLSLLEHVPNDPTEGLPQLRSHSGSDLLARMDTPGVGGTRGLGDAFTAIGGRVGQFLNLTTWYLMKDRSGTVGEKGVAGAVRAVHGQAPGVKLHLVGHSLGGRVMASCAKALCAPPAVRPDSLMLLEAAFSHFGFSPDNGRGQKGFFREVVAEQIVKGPFLSTFSAEDTVVGRAYSIMSRLAGDNTRAIGDARDEFGGIGRNGALRTAEVVTMPLHAAGKAYALKLAVINNLDGSGGLVKNHGDVTNEAITYAFASALART